jgi:hypothetical protein
VRLSAQHGEIAFQQNLCSMEKKFFFNKHAPDILYPLTEEANIASQKVLK